jgi:hypothetical protein
MVVEKIDIECLAVLEAKYDAPISPHCDRPESLQIAF